jgi:hypothetical protein
VINKPGHGNPLHPGAYKGNALTGEEKSVVSILQRPENCFEPVLVIQMPALAHQIFSQM